jgi:hypothetical protein
MNEEGKSPQRKKEQEGGRGIGPGAGEGEAKLGVEKDDGQCTYGDDSGVLSPAFLNKLNNEYLEPS